MKFDNFSIKFLLDNIMGTAVTFLSQLSYIHSALSVLVREFSLSLSGLARSSRACPDSGPPGSEDL